MTFSGHEQFVSRDHSRPRILSIKHTSLLEKWHSSSCSRHAVLIERPARFFYHFEVASDQMLAVKSEVMAGLACGLPLLEPHGTDSSLTTPMPEPGIQNPALSYGGIVDSYRRFEQMAYHTSYWHLKPDILGIEPRRGSAIPS